MDPRPLEYTLKDDDQLFFLHIPKTAGGTFGSILDQYFHRDQIYNFNWDETRRAELFTLPPEKLVKYRLIKGHCYYDAMLKTLPKQPICLTLLRHPLEQIVSHYWHLHTKSNHPAYKPVSQLSLEEFVHRSEFNRFIANIHTRFIGATLNADEFHSLVEYRQAKKSEHHTHKQHQADTLAQAKQRLNEFAVVGLTERFQDTLYLLAYTFGWSPVIQPIHRNVAVYRPDLAEISPETREQITGLSLLDLNLYQYASQLFEARFLQMTQNLLERYGDRSHAALPYPLPEDVMKQLLDRHARRTGYNQEANARGWNGLKRLLAQRVKQYIAGQQQPTGSPAQSITAATNTLPAQGFSVQPKAINPTDAQPLRGMRALIIIPGTVSYFYDAEGRRVAEALQHLGCVAEVHTLNSYQKQTYDWCFLLNLSEIVHAQGHDVKSVMQHIQRLKACSRRVAMILLECVQSTWFNDSLKLLKQAKLNILLDLGFYNQYEYASKQGRAVYHFVFNGLTYSERQTVRENIIAMPEDRPIPWTFVGHLVPVRLRLLQRLIEDVDKRGFVYVVHFTPVTETGPHLNQAQLHEVLTRTRYKIWCSHVEHPYVEAIRFRLALMAGAVPVKINMQPLDIDQPLPFTNLILDEKDFDRKLRAMDFEPTRQNFIDEFCSLPFLEAGLLEILTKLG